MTKLKTLDIIMLIICTLPFIVWLVIYDSISKDVPIHWNASGEVDGWTTKDQLPVFLAIMAILAIGIYLFLRFIKMIDPKRNARINEGVALKIGVGLVAFISLFSILIILPSTGKFNIITIIFVLVSLLFSFLGNLIYNVKPNYFIGIRLPWTLESESNWRLTHRLAGIVWFIGGISCAAVVLVVDVKNMFLFFIAFTVLLVLIPTVYSFVLFRRSQGQDGPK